MNQNDPGTLSEFSVREAVSLLSFVPYFQPVHDAVSGKPVGAEVLARMALPDGRVISPATFLPYVMAVGKMTAMTQVLLEKTAFWLEKSQFNDGFSLSFNVLPDMAGEAWLKEACRQMQQASGGNVTVVIELTECTPLTLPRQTLRCSLMKLREAGVKVALDDFGTGYSGHLRLQQTDADMIKIPREFISNLPECGVSHDIIDSIMLLASRLNLRVIAEGVETGAQINELLRMGVRNIQGYYYSGPLSCSSMNKYMKRYACENNNRMTATCFH